MRVNRILILALIVAACSQNPLTGRKQLTLVPEDQMLSMSLEDYQQFLDQNRQKIVSSGNDALMVKRVGERIAKAVSGYMSTNGMADRMTSYQWAFTLVSDSAVNAWCMPGGKVVVYTGLLPVTQNETALAVVMGHEIAHAIASHGNERLSALLIQEVGFTALDAALANKPEQTRSLFESAVGMGTQLGILLPFSRKQESEADRMGLIFMAMAGYDPNEAIAFWTRMSKLSAGQQPPQFLSTHPSDQTRIATIRDQYLPEALKYYQKP